MDDWSIEPLVLSRDLEDVLALEALCFTNPTTRDMLTWEAERSDVTHAFVLRPPGYAGGGQVEAQVDGQPDGPNAGRVEGQADGPPAMVAYCSVWLIFEELHINTLAVHPAWRRQGLAVRLLRYVLTDAVARGADKATLEVRRSNIAAQRLYERFGFATTAVRTNYYRDPIEDALILWRHQLSRWSADEPPSPSGRETPGVA